MPADYSSAAAALALSPSPEPSPSSPSSSQQPPPPWIHPRRPSHPGGPSASSRRRLSAPYRSQSASSRNKSLARRAWDAANEYGERFRALWLRMTLAQRLLFVAASAAGWAVLILMLVYSERMWAALGPLAKTWRESRAGWLAVWLATFAAAFPPLIGYSTACTVAGFVFGFPAGWPIAATATVAGSAAAFAASRGVLSGYVHRLVGADKRFVALGQVLRRDGLLVLTGVRFCPLPYSLSNGFLATIPSISVWSFSLATALASPKLLAHVFIGSRLAIIAEEGDAMTAGAKAVNYLSAMAGGLVGMTVAVFVYRRTMARAAELAREEAEEIAADGEVRGGDDDDDVAGEDSGLMMDPDDADAAALMVDADDISLWETEGVYRDEEEAVGGKGGGGR